MPALILTTAASEISALTVTTSSRASMTMVGAVWLALTVRPSSATTATTVPSIGAVMRLGTGGLQLRLGGIVFLARGGLGGQHLLLARELQFGLAQGGLLHRALGGDLVQRGLRVEHLVLLGAAPSAT
ncbi:hypothetical protein G6F57_020897 [Rhizopus arrhizus]|nr:hypothetical protein G6F57_020897 [Rhizopus arrhizus]